ncbi:O-methyltransferase [Salinivirga cyanobacteriivorans]
MRLDWLFYQFRKGVKYYLTSKHGRGFGIHSPFVYGLVKEVFMQSKRRVSQYRWIAEMRKELENNTLLLSEGSKGEGSKVKETQYIRAGRLARRSGLPEKYIRLLVKLTNYLSLESVLELGTCCGLTSACLAKGKEQMMVHTIEGNYDRYQFALSMFTKWGVPNIAIENEYFIDVLDRFSKYDARFDMVFMDGDHAYKPTIQYFEKLIHLLNKNGVIVVDDIYWSPGMTKAWKAIQNHPSVTVTIDLYRFGLVFLHRSQAKEHFTIRF